MDKGKVKQINTTALAYMGDAVYEVYVRKYVMESGAVYVDKLHKLGVKYVNAESQAIAIKAIFESLPEDEQRLVKRARNHKIATKAKNVSVISYKWATAFEALVGYLYLAGDISRMEEVIANAMEVINEQSR